MNIHPVLETLYRQRAINPFEAGEAESLRSLGKDLCGKTLLEWMQRVPVDLKAMKSAELSPLEKQTERKLHHIMSACMKPHTYLYVEVQKVFVDRARRIPVGAIAHLAGHTEDWERRQLKGILPKRILAEERQMQIDIYENQLVARLIDHIAACLVQHIREIKSTLQILRETDLSHAIGCWYPRRKRICELWGKSLNSQDELERLKPILKQLEVLKYRVTGLMNSPLYGAIPQRAHVAPTLRRTNILTNDQDYREIAALWRKWMDKQEMSEDLSKQSHIQQKSALFLGMSTYCLLLVIRALRQLGYEPEPSAMGLQIDMTTSWTQIWNSHENSVQVGLQLEANVIRLHAWGKSLVITGVPVDLAGASEQMKEPLQALVEELCNADDGQCLVLYNRPADAPPLGEDKGWLHSVGNSPHSHAFAGCGFLPVSPWDICCVERVARGLRWFLDGVRFTSYPPRFPVPQRLHSTIEALDLPWLSPGDTDEEFFVIRPLRIDEAKNEKFLQEVDKAKAAFESTEEEFTARAKEATSAAKKGRAGSANKAKNIARHDETEAKQKADDLESAYDDYKRAIQHAATLSVCPVCGTKTDNEFKHLEKKCFRCSCTSCRTQWSVRVCSKGHRFPVLLTSIFETAPAPIDTTSPGWEDIFCGSDLLAMPYFNKGEWKFVCPECGERT